MNPSDDPDTQRSEHVALIMAYGRAQSRCTALLAVQTQQIKQLQADVMRLRAQVIQRDSALAYAREDAAAMAAQLPGLPTRVRLARRVEALTERVHELMRDGLAWQRQRKGASAQPAAGALGDVRQKAVLCIGQDAGAATAAQQAIEHAGGRFLHHGGEAGGDAVALEASLVAADLVICQTGCVSHDAYWRVQDHCKRTGKQCVLVEQPQALQFVRRVEDMFGPVPITD